MNFKTCEQLIHQAWEERASLTPEAHTPFKQAIQHTLDALDQGQIRVAEKKENTWIVHQWIKKALLLSFRLYPSRLMPLGGGGSAYDKIPLKWEGWTEEMFAQGGFRVVPSAIARRSAYIAPDVVLMPSFINVGAYVGAGTMIDTWSTVGSCAQVGERCHISGGVGLGGVLEPLQSHPVIIEDECFIGARSEIVEGVLVEKGAVIGMGVFIGASTPIICRESGDVFYGRVPAYSVVISGSRLQSGYEKTPGLSLNCAVIVKRVDEKTRSKTSLTDLLREDKKGAEEKND